MQRLRRSRTMLAGAAVTAALLGFGFWWVVKTANGSPAVLEPVVTMPAAATPATYATPGDRVRDAQAVAEVLTNLPRDPQAAVAPGVTVDARDAIPPEAVVSPDPTTWQPDGAGGGLISVTVTIPGQPPVRYLAVVTWDKGMWKVAATMPVAAADGAPATPSARSS